MLSDLLGLYCLFFFFFLLWLSIWRIKLYIFHTFIMHSYNNTCCIKHGVKHKVHQVPRKQIDSHDIMFKMSAFGLNISSQVCWPLVNCTINQRLLHAAPHSCGMCVVCHFLYDRSSKPVLCTFPDNFIIGLRFQFLSENHRISRRAL